MQDKSIVLCTVTTTISHANFSSTIAYTINKKCILVNGTFLVLSHVEIIITICAKKDFIVH